MTRFVLYSFEYFNLFLLLFILHIFTLSCAVGPIPYRYYDPLSEGKKICQYNITYPNQNLLYVLDNNVLARTKLHFDDATDDKNILLFVIIVPKEQTVRLTSDIVEIHSPELSLPITARVISINEIEEDNIESCRDRILAEKGKYGVMEAELRETPPLGPLDELYGYKIEEPAFYMLNFEYFNDNKVIDETPQDVTVYLPDIYINDELHQIGPLKFKSTWTAIFL